MRLTTMCLLRHSSRYSRTSLRQALASWPSVMLVLRSLRASRRVRRVGVHLLALKNSGMAWNLKSEDSGSRLVEEQWGSSSLMMKGEHSKDWNSLEEQRARGGRVQGEAGTSPLPTELYPFSESCVLRWRVQAVLAFSLMLEAFFISLISPLDRATSVFLGLMLLMIWMHSQDWLLLRECRKGKSFWGSATDWWNLLPLGSPWREESTDWCCCWLDLQVIKLLWGEVVFLRVEAMKPLGLDLLAYRGLRRCREARLSRETMKRRLTASRCFSSWTLRCVLMPSQFLVTLSWCTRQRRSLGTTTLQLFTKPSMIACILLKSPPSLSDSSSFPSTPWQTGSLFSRTSSTTSLTISCGLASLQSSGWFLSSAGLVHTMHWPLQLSPMVSSPTLTSLNLSWSARYPSAARWMRNTASGSISLPILDRVISMSSMQMSNPTPLDEVGGSSQMQRQCTMGDRWSCLHWYSCIMESRFQTVLRYFLTESAAVAASSQGQRGWGRARVRLREVRLLVGLSTEYLSRGRLRFLGKVFIPFLTIVFLSQR